MATIIQLINSKRGVYWIHPTKLHKSNRLWVGPFASVFQAVDNARDELKDDIDASIQFANSTLLDELTNTIDDGVQKVVEERVKITKAENARLEKTADDVMRRLSGE